MGSCCFTPTKRDFLWWYWLLLASIVGIPMLLAVLYVARHPGTDEETKKRRGRRAAWIFWAGTWVVAVSIFFIVDALLKAFYSDPSDRSYWGIGYAVYAYRDGWAALAVQFCIATVAANGANSLVRKRRLLMRIPLVVLCLGMFWITVVTVFHRQPAINLMQSWCACCLHRKHFQGHAGHQQGLKPFGFLAAATLFSGVIFR